MSEIVRAFLSLLVLAFTIFLNGMMIEVAKEIWK